MEVRKYILGLLWLAFAFAAWSFLGNYLAPDACLDSGGSFDYSAWSCSHSDNKTYTNVPAFWVPGFWLAASSFVIAVFVTVSLSPTKRSNRSRRSGAPV
jgi:hypothetical protein